MTMNLNLSDLAIVIPESTIKTYKGGRTAYRNWVLVNYPKERHRLWVPEAWMRTFRHGEPLALAMIRRKA